MTFNAVLLCLTAALPSALSQCEADFSDPPDSSGISTANGGVQTIPVGAEVFYQCPGMKSFEVCT